MTDTWKVDSLSLASTAGVFYILCTIFDALFPPFRLIAAVSPHSPWPLFGSPLGFLSGFVTFTVGGLVLGALYGIARDISGATALIQAEITKDSQTSDAAEHRDRQQKNHARTQQSWLASRS